MEGFDKIQGSFAGSRSSTLALQAKSSCNESNNEATAGTEPTDYGMGKYCTDSSIKDDQLFILLGNKGIKIKDQAFLVRAGNKILSTNGTSGITINSKDNLQNILDYQNKLAKLADESVSIAQTNFDKPDNKGKTSFETILNEANANKRAVAKELAKAELDLKNYKPETEGNTSSDTTNSICAKLLAQQTDANFQKTSKNFDNIISTALELSKGTSSETKTYLSKVVGEMQDTPCGSIANNSGSKNFLDWLQRGPEAGTGALGK
jgi:hypothetical protein